SPSVADHPLRSATHRCLGELLSHQLANATRAHLLATARRAVFHFFFRRRRILFGISTSFPVLSRTIRQVAHVLLTHPPLIPQTYTRRLLSASCARLACIRHAASARPEPRSSSGLSADRHTVRSSSSHGSDCCRGLASLVVRTR